MTVTQVGTNGFGNPTVCVTWFGEKNKQENSTFTPEALEKAQSFTPPISSASLGFGFATLTSDFRGESNLLKSTSPASQERGTPGMKREESDNIGPGWGARGWLGSQS